MPTKPVIWLAPAGGGKTYTTINLSKTFSCTIFLAPLRAIISEIDEKLNHENIPHITLKNHKDTKALIKKKWVANEKIIILSTPELLPFHIIENMAKDFHQDDVLLVLDEFHLFIYWGRSFRPILEEWYYLFFQNSICALGLTATLDQNFILEIKENIKLGANATTIINCGNQKIRNNDYTTFYMPNFARKNLVPLLKKIENKKMFPLLIFCQYRFEVESLEVLFQQYGFKCLSCIGGESTIFSQKLKETSNIEIIIATSVLSHGVNLPEIRTVILTYPILEKDFLIQMMGRGGRRGSHFEIYSVNKEGFSMIEKFLGHIKFYLMIKWYEVLYGQDQVEFNQINGKNHRCHNIKQNALSGEKSTLSRFAQKWINCKFHLLWWQRWREKNQGLLR